MHYNSTESVFRFVFEAGSWNSWSFHPSLRGLCLNPLFLSAWLPPLPAWVSDDAWRVSTPATVGDDCRIHGNLRAESVVVGERNEVFGSLRAREDVAVGAASTIHGDVTTRGGTVTIEADAHVRGDVSAGDLVIHDGAEIDGSLRARGEMKLVQSVEEDDVDGVDDGDGGDDDETDAESESDAEQGPDTEAVEDAEPETDEDGVDPEESENTGESKEPEETEEPKETGESEETEPTVATADGSGADAELEDATDGSDDPEDDPIAASGSLRTTLEGAESVEEGGSPEPNAPAAEDDEGTDRE